MTEPVEDQAAAALAAVLRSLPDEYPVGMTPVVYRDHVGNTVFIEVSGVRFYCDLMPE